MLVLGQFLGGIGVPPSPLVQAAELIMRGGMLGLELDNGFELMDGVIHIARAFLGQAKLKVESGDGWINFLRLLKSFDRLRRLMAALPEPSRKRERRESDAPSLTLPALKGEYDVRDLLKSILDDAPFDEYKSEYGQTLVCGYGRLGGIAIGVVANQRQRCKPAVGPLQYGGVIYVDSADKTARFVMDCNQARTPLLFFQDVNGFMVGRESEQSGIIRAGAKLVNVIANSVVPKITLITGGSYGAGNYALCGKAFDPRFIFAWPTAHYAVMGGDQAASTLLEVQVQALKRKGHEPDAKELEDLRDKVKAAYDATTDIRYAAARLWIDGIVEPADSRTTLLTALEIATRFDDGRPFKTGVLQV
jgi:acetyl-CoA carboxylase carboxyltransferase component